MGQFWYLSIKILTSRRGLGEEKESYQPSNPLDRTLYVHGWNLGYLWCRLLQLTKVKFKYMAVFYINQISKKKLPFISFLV